MKAVDDGVAEAVPVQPPDRPYVPWQSPYGKDRGIVEAFEARVARIAAEASKRKLRVYDFDSTLASSIGMMSVTKASGGTVKMDSVTWSYFEPKVGDTLDFSDFNDVTNPRVIKKNFDRFKKDAGDEETATFILTARPKGSESSIAKFLESQGVKGVQVIALQSSDPNDKARWIDAETDKGGFDDVEFLDDSAKNVQAVATLKEKRKGIRIESENVPRPSKDSDYDGKVIEKVFTSDRPTISKVKVDKPRHEEPKKTEQPKEELKSKAPIDSRWWKDQSDDFRREYCREHPGSRYCGK